jgi:hypothetical protein
VTDPIEQARHSVLIGASNAVVLGILAGDAYEPMLAYERAILHHHPDVVRLVLAARRAKGFLEAAYAREFDTRSAAEARPFAAQADALDAALDPFKEVQE